jgi:hypothetical protein
MVLIELDSLMHVSGGASGGQIATRGTSSETTLQALSNAYTHESKKTVSLMLVL